MTDKPAPQATAPKPTPPAPRRAESSTTFVLVKSNDAFALPHTVEILVRGRTPNDAVNALGEAYLTAVRQLKAIDEPAAPTGPDL